LIDRPEIVLSPALTVDNFDFEKAEVAIKEGRDCVKEKLGEIRETIETLQKSFET
jgi:hypothetical protein